MLKIKKIIYISFCNYISFSLKIYTSFSESEDLKQSFKFYYNILEILYFP